MCWRSRPVIYISLITPPSPPLPTLAAFDTLSVAADPICVRGVRSEAD